MSNPAGKAEVPGSRKHPIPEARTIAPADPNEHAEVTVLLRRGSATAPRAAGPESQPLSIEEFEAQHGASSEDISKVESAPAHTGKRMMCTLAPK